MHSFVKYVIKLGYTAEQGELAISTLGSDAITNDLLTLVISLSSTTSARQNELKQKKLQRNPRPRCIGYKLDKLYFITVPINNRD